MAKESNQMHTTEVELKAIAKAVGSSLKRAGHTVPHSTVLHALSAALNKRDWHKLKASLEGASTTAPAAEGTPGSAPAYSERTWFFLRLAFALERPVSPLPADDALALMGAFSACRGTLDGTLSWGGWNIPAALKYESSRVDSGDFVPANPAKPGRFIASLPAVGRIEFEAAYVDVDRNWCITATGAEQFKAALEKKVPDADVLAFAQRDGAAENLPGPYVKAEFWTDDRVFEVEFDARPYLMQASDTALADIIEAGYRGDYSTDYVAEYVNDNGLNQDLAEAFAYIGAIQKSGRKNDIGFEVSVDDQSFLRWMDEQRPVALACALCDRAGVRIVQAEEEEIAGRWDWLDEQGNASASSLETAEEAALDAYLSLGLFQRALDGSL